MERPVYCATGRPFTRGHLRCLWGVGLWCCGAVTNTGQWFQVQWPESWSEINIAIKEMVPVVISVAIWGREWAKSLLLVRTDNMACPHSRNSQRPAADAPAVLHAFFHSHRPDRHSGQTRARCLKHSSRCIVTKQNDCLLCIHPTGAQGDGQGPTPTAGHAVTSAPRLDVARLEENVSFFLGQALAPATLRSYKSGQRRFLRFCQDARLQPLPLTEQLMCMFVAQLGAESLSYQTIKCYLSAVHHYSIMGGQGDLFGPGALPVLQYVLRGVRRRPQPPAQPRLPITPQILRCLKAQWSAHAAELNYIMLWALVVSVFSAS